MRNRETELEGEDVGRGLAIAGAAALPFAGYAGKGALRNYRQGPATTDWRDISRTLRPGDVLISGDGKLTPLKALIGLGQGTPEAYHVATVGRDGRIVDAHSNFGAKKFDHATWLNRPRHNVQVLRPTLTKQELKAYLKNLDSYVSLAEQLDATGGFAARQRLFNKRRGVVAGLKDLLLPAKNLPPPQIAAEQDAVLRDIATQTKLVRAATRLNAAARQAACRNVGGIGVCSTFPAIAMPGGVTSNKRPLDVVPTDYLRSKKFTPVARLAGSSGGPVNRLLGAAPLLTRLGLGAILAGGVAQLTSPHEDAK